MPQRDPVADQASDSTDGLPVWMPTGPVPEPTTKVRPYVPEHTGPLFKRANADDPLSFDAPLPAAPRRYTGGVITPEEAPAIGAPSVTFRPDPVRRSPPPRHPRRHVRPAVGRSRERRPGVCRVRGSRRSRSALASPTRSRSPSGDDPDPPPRPVDAAPAAFARGGGQ
jgi:hypothetical protein